MRKKSCCSILDFDSIPTLFKALGDPNRLALFKYICTCHRDGVSECNVGELSTCCDLDLSVVSRHLAILRDVGILSATKKGKEVNYSLNGGEISKMLRALADYIDSCACNTKTQKKE